MNGMSLKARFIQRDFLLHKLTLFYCIKYDVTKNLSQIPPNVSEVEVW